VRLRLSDETVWTSEFTADGAGNLARGIAAAWDERIELVRRVPGATHPAFALAARLTEIDRWLAERLARPVISDEQRRSWDAQTRHWRYTARVELGGDERDSPLRLHVWAPGDEGTISVWSTLCSRTPSGGWTCNPHAPRVARHVDTERALALWEGACAMAAWARKLDGFAEHVGDAVRAAMHPRPTLVR
jgi:hypothetical protein